MRSVRLLGLDKSGHNKRGNKPTVKTIDLVIMAQDGHAEFRFNENVYNISVNCEF